MFTAMDMEQVPMNTWLFQCSLPVMATSALFQILWINLLHGQPTLMEKTYFIKTLQ